MVERFEFEFHTHQPEGALARLVESLWYARGTVPYERERIAPTGSTVAVFVLGDAIIETPDDGNGTPLHADKGFLIGPHDRPVLNEPTGETHAFGIVTTPVGCHSVFDLAPSSIRGRVLELMTAWAPAADLRNRLAEREPQAALGWLEQQLVEHTVMPGVDTERIERAIAMLENDPTRSIAMIAGDLGISHGYFDRQFGEVVGLSPRRFSRLIRMRRFLQSLDVSVENPWTAIAAELGWFDQSHFIRDFKRHTGTTPNRYVAAQRRVMSPTEPGDVAGFVPELAEPDR